ncbi:MAG: DUF4823 domain-containing protein [Ketobacteraceae bacterium]|nr:DUF4823 domain-containing protein [Ketobacteraceae bacterium]
MRWLLLVLMAAGVLWGCQSSHPAARTSTSWMGEFSPVGSYRVARRHNLVLPYDASIYVANPARALMTDEGVDLNTLLAEKLKKGFSRNFSQVYPGLSKERFHQALHSARQLGAQFMVMGEIEQWADIKPVKLKPCEEDQEVACPEEKGGSEGDSNLSVAVYETVSGRLVDLMSIHSQRGIMAYLFEDNQKPLDQLVTEVVGSLTEKH